MKQCALNDRKRLKAIALIESRGLWLGVDHHADVANLVGGPTGERQGEPQQGVADPAALRLFSNREPRHPEHGQGIARELTAARPSATRWQEESLKSYHCLFMKLRPVAV